MARALTILGMVVAGLLLILFSLDLAVGLPFHGENKVMDGVFVLCALGLAYLSWLSMREWE